MLIIHVVPGDSGAWVFDKSTGRVCGHVLAWSEKNRMAYIAPMDILLEDIARTLHASQITLPGNPGASVSYNIAQPTPIGPQHPRYHAQLQIPEQLPVDIGRLNIGLDDRRIGSVSPSRDLRRARSPYHHQTMPLLTPPRSLERQLA